tara:strand:+ start:120 stop:452 length:333 start_codon:yes stop_codon:yes gene_type:complete
MSRLLHAAARGARIEGSYKEFDIWNSISAVRFDNFYDYRIHPDDEHLAYGPISTALREMAETCTHSSSWAGFLATSAANEYTMFFDSRFGEPDYPLFYLILAEALADEGM